MEQNVRLIDKRKEDQNELVLSYASLRNLIGVCGALLPIALWGVTFMASGINFPQSSISAYYYTVSGDILVALLCSLGVFLITYNGYNWKEKFLSILAAICGIGVAFSPTAANCDNLQATIHVFKRNVPCIFGVERHFYFAGIFFISISIISLCFFPLSKEQPPHKDQNNKLTRKGKRNIIYKTCGWIMLGCVAVLAIYSVSLPFQKIANDFPVTFLFETIALEAFAFSWLTKGETFLHEGDHYLKTGYNNFKRYLSKNKQ